MRRKNAAEELRLKEGTVEGRERGASDLPRGGGFTRSIDRKSRQEGLGRFVQLGRCYDCLAMGNKSMEREAGEEDVSRGGRKSRGRGFGGSGREVVVEALFSPES